MKVEVPTTRGSAGSTLPRFQLRGQRAEFNIFWSRFLTYSKKVCLKKCYKLYEGMYIGGKLQQGKWEGLEPPILGVTEIQCSLRSTEGQAGRLEHNCQCWLPMNDASIQNGE